MNILGIVAEFNPFHSGHSYLIESARKAGAKHIVCIMSGNFVQRGEVAIASKKARAEMALDCGADLVIELPVIYATATAQKFAYGAVSTLAALGCVDTLAFGSECGDTMALRDIASALCDDKVTLRMREIMQSGVTFATAREQALCDCGYNGKILQGPNDTLAVSYIEAINSSCASMAPYAVKRIGVGHDSGAQGDFASASHIRRLICDGDAFSRFMPKSSYDILIRELAAKKAPMDMSRLEMGMLARLRSMSLSEISALPDISEGLENKLYKAIFEQSRINDIIESVKSKRYTHARIRRLVLSAFLGIDAKLAGLSPQYIRVLGINKKGREILSAARPTLPVIVRAKDAGVLTSDGKLMLAAEQRADNLAKLATQAALPCESTLSQIVIRE